MSILLAITAPLAAIGVLDLLAARFARDSRPGFRRAHAAVLVPPPSPAFGRGSAFKLPGMALPLRVPVLPQLARSAKVLPSGDGRWAFEPKWDGFRAIAFVDGDDVHLQSRNGKPLT